MTGITNDMGMNKLDNYLFSRVGPELATLALVDYQKVSGVAYQRCSTTVKGKQFLSRLNLSELDKTETAKPNQDADASAALSEVSEKSDAAVAKGPKPKLATRKKVV